MSYCNFADDTTIFAADCQLDKVLERLETDALILSKWFPENFMKLNAGKFHLLTFGTNQDDIKIKIGEAIVEESSEEKLLGVIIDTNLNFKSHVSNLCKRARQKLHALARVSPFMGSDKLRLLMNSFIKAQFSYQTFIYYANCKQIIYYLLLLLLLLHCPSSRRLPLLSFEFAFSFVLLFFFCFSHVYLSLFLYFPLPK